jgi:hypothetical protein
MSGNKIIVDISKGHGKSVVTQTTLSEEDIKQAAIDHALWQTQLEEQIAAAALPTKEEQLKALLDFAVTGDNSKVVEIHAAISDFNTQFRSKE